MNFRERDVSRDPAALSEMVRRSGQRGVPVIAIDGEVVVGFNRGQLESILSRPSRPRPTLGARVAGAGPVARRQGISLPPGAYVGKVKPGSPAERAGLREGDVIQSLAGREVQRSADLGRVLSTLTPGEAVPIRWWRDGRVIERMLPL